MKDVEFIHDEITMSVHVFFKRGYDTISGAVDDIILNGTLASVLHGEYVLSDDDIDELNTKYHQWEDETSSHSYYSKIAG